MASSTQFLFFLYSEPRELLENWSSGLRNRVPPFSILGKSSPSLSHDDVIWIFTPPPPFCHNHCSGDLFWRVENGLEFGWKCQSPLSPTPPTHTHTLELDMESGEAHYFCLLWYSSGLCACRMRRSGSSRSSSSSIRVLRLIRNKLSMFFAHSNPDPLFPPCRCHDSVASSRGGG